MVDGSVKASHALREPEEGRKSIAPPFFLHLRSMLSPPATPRFSQVIGPLPQLRECASDL